MNVERMRRAVALLSAIPASAWNMDRYSGNIMSSACCALGHLAKRGFEGLKLEGKTGPNYMGLLGFEAGAALFDLPVRDSLTLFYAVLGERHGKSPGMVDKEIFFARLERVCARGGIWYGELFKVVDDVPEDAPAEVALASGGVAREGTTLWKRMMARFAGYREHVE